MSISSTTRKAGPYTGNGATTALPFSFKVFSQNDVLVVRTTPAGLESELSLGADYSVHLNVDQDTGPGGVVSLVVPAGIGYLTTVTSTVPDLQPVVLTNAGGFYPRVINEALDRLTILVQQVAEKAGRAVKVGISSNVSPDDLVNTLVTGATSASTSAASAAASAVAAQSIADNAQGLAQAAASSASSAAQISAGSAATSAAQAAASALLASAASGLDLTNLAAKNGGNATGTWPIDISGVAEKSNVLTAHTDGFTESTLPASYPMGLCADFAYLNANWPSLNYGSLITMHGYSAGGGTLQMYAPYGPNYGGRAMRVRFGNYEVNDGNSWTPWKDLIASDMIGSGLSYSGGVLSATGGGVSSVNGAAGAISAAQVAAAATAGYGYTPPNPAVCAPMTSFVGATSYEYSTAGSYTSGTKVLFVRANGSTFELVTEFSRYVDGGG